MIAKGMRLFLKVVTVAIRTFTTGRFIKRVPLENHDIPGEPLPDYSLPDAIKDDDETDR